MDINKIMELKNNDFEHEVLQKSGPIVVYFYSEDCPVCERFGSLYEKFAEKFGDSISFYKVFRQQNRQFAEKFKVKTSPTVMFFNNGKEVCSRLTGYIDANDMKSSIENVLEGKCQETRRRKVNCDVVILGAGPAGLSAAIYAARARLFTVVIDESIPGGQVATTFNVANYPGTNGVVRGLDLMENMKRQAVSFGANIDDLMTVKSVDLNGRTKYIETEDTDYYAKAVIIATGAQPRKLPAEGETEFRGKGVHYCATCDGPLYQDADVMVIGGGESALEEAEFLTRYCKHVTIVNRSENLRACKSAQDKTQKNPNISFIWDTEIVKIQGEAFLTSVIARNNKTGETAEIKTDGLFVYIGMEPRSSLFRNQIRMTEYGYIPTDENMLCDIEGVFAAGDVREKKVRQIANAVGDGAIAGTMAERYINEKA